eukprot:4768225-Lingulodinium_polyedra.AAC.1
MSTAVGAAIRRLNDLTTSAKSGLSEPTYDARVHTLRKNVACAGANAGASWDTSTSSAEAFTDGVATSFAPVRPKLSTITSANRKSASNSTENSSSEAVKRNTR